MCHTHHRTVDNVPPAAAEVGMNFRFSVRQGHSERRSHLPGLTRVPFPRRATDPRATSLGGRDGTADAATDSLFDRMNRVTCGNTVRQSASGLSANVLPPALMTPRWCRPTRRTRFPNSAWND